MSITRRGLAAIAAAAVLALGLSACTGGADSGSTAGTGTATDAEYELVLGITSEPLSFDPAQAEEGTRLPFYQAVYDTLLLREPDGTLAPMLATEWEVAPDGLSITLKLRDDVVFSDESKFTSATVKANLERFQAENGPQAATLATLAGVDTPDETTAVIRLTEPDPAMTIYLSSAAGLMASTEALTSESIKTTPVGSGPYLLNEAETSVGVRYTYERKNDYWGAELPYSTIQYSILPDAQAMLNALRSGQINATVFFNPTQGQEAQDAGFQYWPVEADYQGLVIFDREGEKVPALGDVKVRQAINYAIDREQLLSVFMLDRGTVTQQIWGTSSAGYDESLDNTYTFDPAKARKLLADAGYADGFDIEIPTVPQFDPAMMAAIAQMLQDVGIRATLVDVPFADFFGQLRGGEWPLAYMRFFQPSDWQLINQFIAPEASWNSFHSTDATVAGLIEKIQVASGDDVAPLAQELNAHIVDEAWFAPFYRVEQQTFTDVDTTVTPQVEQAAPSIYNWAPKQ